MSARQLPAFGPITAEQQQRMDQCDAQLASVRADAQYRILLDAEAAKENPAAVNCARCERIGSFSPEKQSGFCLRLRHMVSTWHVVECRAFKAH